MGILSLRRRPSGLKFAPSHINSTSFPLNLGCLLFAVLHMPPCPRSIRRCLGTARVQNLSWIMIFFARVQNSWDVAYAVAPPTAPSAPKRLRLPGKLVSSSCQRTRTQLRATFWISWSKVAHRLATTLVANCFQVMSEVRGDHGRVHISPMSVLLLPFGERHPILPLMQATGRGSLCAASPFDSVSI